MVIVCDTRQQKSKHDKKELFFAQNGVKTIRSKLPAGDYALLTDMSRVIDTKKNLQELVGNIIQDHDRFRREADFCRDNGIELIILIEEEKIKTLDDVRNWENPRLHQYNKIKFMHRYGKWMNVPLPAKPPTNNITLLKIMSTFGKEHHVRWEFCKPNDAGRRIIELLQEGKIT